MEPYLRAWPQKKRNLWFGPFVILGFILGFLLGAVPTAEFVVGLLVGPILGLGGAYALVGWPHLTTRSGKALVTPEVKPWLFLATFPVLALAAYIILGVFLTPVLPPGVLPYVALTAAVIIAAGVSWFLVGVPPVLRVTRTQWSRIPEARKPWLFFPIALLAGALAYVILGVAVANAPFPPSVDDVMLDLEPFIITPIAVLVGAGLAYALVGIPRPSKPIAEYVPEVPGRMRLPVFLVTFLILGVPFAYLAGLALGFVPGLPDDALLVSAFFIGYAASLGVAAAAWGTPKRWSRYPDYKPGIPAGVRTALFLPVVFGVALVVTVALNLAGADLYWGLLAGGILGVLAAARVTGLSRRLKALRAEQETLLPELPDKVKPLVLFPVWFTVSAALVLLLAFPFPGALPWVIAVGVPFGLVIALALVEAPTFREILEERRERKERVKAWKRKRAEALKEARVR